MCTFWWSRNSLVDKVEFLGLITKCGCKIANYYVVLRASCLTLEIKEFWGENRGKWKGRQSVAARCATEAFSTTCAVHIEDWGGGWLSGYRGSVAEHWRLKPEVSWVRLPVTAGLLTQGDKLAFTEAKWSQNARSTLCVLPVYCTLGGHDWGTPIVLISQCEVITHVCTYLVLVSRAICTLSQGKNCPVNHVKFVGSVRTYATSVTYKTFCATPTQNIGIPK